MNNVILVAIGQMFLDRALLSIQSLRQSGYTDPIKLVTSMPDNVPDGTDATVIAVDAAPARQYKTNFLAYADPTAEHVLFLDCDTYAVSAIDALWNVGDLGMVVGEKTPAQKCSGAELAVMEGLGTADVYCYNSGVILATNSPANRALCTAWQTEWTRFGLQDEMALLRALATTGQTVTELDNKFNSRRPTDAVAVIRHCGWWMNTDGTWTERGAAEDAAHLTMKATIKGRKPNRGNK